MRDFTPHAARYTNYHSASSFDRLWDYAAGKAKAEAAQRRQDRANRSPSMDSGRSTARADSPAASSSAYSSRASSTENFHGHAARRSSFGPRAASAASQQASQSRARASTPAAAAQASSMRCNAISGPAYTQCPFYTAFTGAVDVRQLDLHHLKVHEAHRIYESIRIEYVRNVKR